MATFSVHFDGPIAVDHKVSIRVLARTYEHMQRAIDRAYLIELYGEVWKHARLTDAQYRETEFIAQYPREGGIFLDAVREGGEAIVDRIASAIRPVFEAAAQRGVQQNIAMAAQIASRRNFTERMGGNTPTYDAVAAEPPPNWATAYSNRSVIKEIDQLVAQVTPEQLQGSVVELHLQGDTAHLPFIFTRQVASRFHMLAAKRELGAAFIVTARIRSLDMGNRHTMPSAKIENVSSNREVILQLPRREDFDTLHPFHNGQEVHLFVCPIVEALGFDLNGGDLLFLGMA